MYRNAYQRGMLTIFFSGGAKPLNIWDTYTQDGYITRFLDQDIKSMVLEIGGTNVSTTYMICPKGNTVLGITMPFLVMVVKNLKKYFTFEVTILDETGTRRRFRVSNFQSTTQILPLCTVMPIGLSEGWNQIQFNLAEFTRRAYKKQFVEVQKLKINANIRLRRIYFAERLLPEDQLPPEYKLYFPLPHKSKLKKADEAKNKENVAAEPIVPVEEKKIEKEKSHERMPSRTEVVQAVSKASVHSVKKISSKQSSKVRLEVERTSGSKRGSVVTAPVEAQDEKIIPVDGKISESAAVLVKVAESNKTLPSLESEHITEGLDDSTPYDDATEEKAASIPEESLTQPEERPPEPPRPQSDELAPETPEAV